ncbi:phosphatidylinositol kinase [Paenibacillus sp. HN-1]|uniref:phosphatidylinositol kinase n=1 Tax=Paenibacillus TaxID=44249 RepID=UPI001CA8E183|nr:MULTISPECIES: phosphatidylinositol kinase [Paenibacillus]MBY9081024.1 phosphatidylinositol kinase [Paenibacillus sp. CGMCC 1.18879]MBY9087061.1 phosphatidylinositol kinase [Paenibacillus sinensis]
METNYQQISWTCMNKYVGITTSDGASYDGFIAHVDPDFVTLAVPTTEMMDQMSGMSSQKSTYRQFGFHPGFFPRRRFIRTRIPFGSITTLFLLPFFI